MATTAPTSMLTGKRRKVATQSMRLEGGRRKAEAGLPQSPVPGQNWHCCYPVTDIFWVYFCAFRETKVY